MTPPTKTKTALEAERDEAARLRGSHEQRWADEERARNEKEAQKNAAFNRTHARIDEVDRLAGLFHGDLIRQQAKVGHLEQERQALRSALYSSTENAVAELEAIASRGSVVMEEWLRHLPRALESAPPPVEALTLYALKTDPGFTEFLLTELKSIAEVGSPKADPRGKKEIRSQLKKVEDDLSTAQPELDRRRQVLLEAQAAVRAAGLGEDDAVTAFLKNHAAVVDTGPKRDSEGRKSK